MSLGLRNNGPVLENPRGGERVVEWWTGGDLSDGGVSNTVQMIFLCIKRKEGRKEGMFENKMIKKEKGVRGLVR